MYLPAARPLSLVLLASSAFSIPSTLFARNETSEDLPRRRCGTTITQERIQQLEERFAASRLDTNLIAPPTGWPQTEVEVYWHVIVANNTYEGGWIPREALAMQMEVLNADYADVGITFNAKLVTRIVNEYWFLNIVHPITFPSLQDSMKRKYRTGGPGTLNVYTVSFAGEGTLGYATLPADYEGYEYDDGIVLRWDTLPGGQVPYNYGKTLTHETGHWLGLYHTFQGGSCTGPGDRVSDTPPQMTETFRCPEIKDTCPGDNLPDAIHNYMDYSDDLCLTEFTPGQAERMRQQVALFRGLGVPSGGVPAANTVQSPPATDNKPSRLNNILGGSSEGLSPNSLGIAGILGADN